ncbi:SDR family NAD(P)-dependent oxidoreductase [Actinospongicola halichondriae]|uniref:SDR family NAD(P)-dependent oxidoreductase n=1 Tax=Actinospongicola halichondriae TaxID=3236844 RepID=UPI003D59AEED
MSGRLDGMVALVVGGGQTPGETIGNGRAICVRFAQEGASVVVVDRVVERAEETVAQLAADGHVAVALGGDVTSGDDCKAMVDAAVETFGRLDVLVNNVGIGGRDGGPVSLDEEVWDRIQDVNLKGMYLTCKHALPVMRAQGSGAIVNISSLAAVASTNMLAYKTSKAGVNALTQSVANGNAKHGIRANAIMPGLMDTPMAVDVLAGALGVDRAEVADRRAEQVPLRQRQGTAWDVANAALFLASDEAQFITGVVLPVDGGQAARIG